MPKHEYGQEGFQLRRVLTRRALMWGVPMLVLAVVALTLVFVRPPFCVSLLMVLLIPVYPGFFKWWDRKSSQAMDSYATGLEGEKALAAALRDGLAGDEYYLVHDLDFGRGNVDHVVVAPAGIFTIETKADAGTVAMKKERLYVNRFDRERDLKQAFAEAMVVRDYLQGISRSKQVPDGHRYFVTPVLVFTRARVPARAKCRGVHVMGIAELSGFVSTGGQRLDAKQRSAIAAALSAKVAR